MSAAPGRMMMAWVWISLVSLARLHTAEPHRDAAVSLAGLERCSRTLSCRLGDGGPREIFPGAMWKFMKGSGPASDFSRPQYRCSGVSLFVRFTLVQHTDLRLEDGSRVSSAGPVSSSVRIFGPWLLLTSRYQLPHGLWIKETCSASELQYRLSPLGVTVKFPESSKGLEWNVVPTVEPSILRPAALGKRVRHRRL
ncbi:hypothetical protein D5F01_LYC24675 [Larimichthys crocea]|uniref:Uncharacterized protein n=1 Tax=Larimichthys crocea TaxID=215358 RepID=A0A6G0HDZ5_LARCR|nr:hypothetical protein D5F01_LYC24675 [Larimichthys crocea]